MTDHERLVMAPRTWREHRPFGPCRLLQPGPVPRFFNDLNTPAPFPERGRAVVTGGLSAGYVQILRKRKERVLREPQQDLPAILLHVLKIGL